MPWVITAVATLTDFQGFEPRTFCLPDGAHRLCQSLAECCCRRKRGSIISTGFFFEIRDIFRVFERSQAFFFFGDCGEGTKKCQRVKTKSSDVGCLLSTGLEPMTLALSEPRATNCARRANSQVMELYQVCSMSGFLFFQNVRLPACQRRGETGSGL